MVVPQFEQKVRITPGEEWYSFGLPLTSRKQAFGRIIQATD
jgi:hypothetical protein